VICVVVALIKEMFTQIISMDWLLGKINYCFYSNNSTNSKRRKKLHDLSMNKKKEIV
jgi:hypothetical protein